jgi:hypothetical protein
LLAAIFVFSFTFDLTGFEKRVPDTNRINAVNITAFIGNAGAFPPRSGFTRSVFISDNEVRLSSAENIAAFREFHKSIVENRTQIEENRDFRFNVWSPLHYDLKGLSNMSRRYILNYGFVRDSRELAQIFESEEYKSHFLLSDADLAGLSYIEITNTSFHGKRTMITGRDNMKELLTRVDLDFRAQTYKSAVSFRNPYAEFVLTYEDTRTSNRQLSTNIIIPRDYTNTIEWLKDNGYAEQIEVTSDMVSSIIVFREQHVGSHWSNSRPGRAIDTAEISENTEPVEITDKEQIAVILETFETTAYAAESYRIEIRFETDFLDYRERFLHWTHYSAETLPAFIRELF